MSEARKERWLGSPIRRSENRRRIIFFIKLGFFIGLIGLEIIYPDWEDQWHLSSHYVKVGLGYFLAHMIVSLLRLGFVGIYLRSHRYDWYFKDNLVLGTNRIANILNVVVLFIFSLLLFNIDPREFFTGLSIFAAAIAILFKDYVTNLLNGMILMFSNQLALNDDVKVGQHRGYLKDINLINVSLVNENGETIYIPNNTVLTVDVVNYSKTERKRIMVEGDIDLARVRDANWLQKRLWDALEPYRDNLKTSAFRMEVIKVGKDVMSVQVHAQLRRQHAAMHYEVKRVLNQAMIDAIYEQKA